MVMRGSVLHRLGHVELLERGRLTEEEYMSGVEGSRGICYAMSKTGRI